MQAGVSTEEIRRRFNGNRWELVSAERASAGPIRVAGKRADDLFELWCYRLLRLQAA